MEAPQEKVRIQPRFSKQKILWLGVAAVALALIIALCISISLYRNMQERYTSARDSLGEAVYENLYMMLRRNEEISLAGADVQGTVLPAMREYFLAAQALNTSLQNTYGARYAVLSPDQTSALAKAFSDYDAAFKGGRPTDAAKSALASSMQQVQSLLDERFDEDGRLLPAS